MKKVAVAIDGPSGAGKSTIARAVAAKLKFIYVDTGALYRAIGLAAWRAGIPGDDERQLGSLLPQIAIKLRYQDGKQHVLLNDEDVSEAIRTPEISRYASLVSTLPCVRTFLLTLQRDMANTHHVIMDGRDIGTVILPDAQVKIFLTADAKARANRRYLELIEKGQHLTLQQVLADMQARDRQDTERAAAPLRQAEDAVCLDTSNLTLEQSIEAVLQIIQNAI